MRDHIRANCRPGEFLEPEVGLAERMGVSRNTLRKAMRELEVEGLIERLPGKGSRVSLHYEAVSMAEWISLPEFEPFRTHIEEAGLSVRYDTSYTAGGYRAKIREDLEAGAAPDLFLMYSPYAGPIFPYALDLTRLVRNDPALTTPLTDGILERLTVGPRIVGLPLMYSPLVNVAHAELAASVDEERLMHGSKDGFAALCHALTRFNGTVYEHYGYIHNHHLGRMVPLLMAGGWNMGNHPQQCRPMCCPENIETLRILGEAVAGASLPLPSAGWRTEYAEQYHLILEHLAERRAVFIVDRAGFEIEQIKDLGAPIRYFPLFFDNRTQPPIVTLYGLINAASPRVEKAWEVLRSFLSEDCQRRLVENGLGVPLRRDLVPKDGPEHFLFEYARRGHVLMFPADLMAAADVVAELLSGAVLRLRTPEEALRACDEALAEQRRAMAPAGGEAPVRTIPVALVQFDAVPEQTARNLKQMERLAARAVKDGARWVLFHAGTVTDYTPRLRMLAEAVPNGQSTRRMVSLARRLRCWISFGLSEKSNGHCYLTQVFIGPEGFVYRYRKTWLYHRQEDDSDDFRDEWARYDPGTGPEAFEFDGVRCTCFICADGGARRCIELAAELRPALVFYPNNRTHIPQEQITGYAKTIGATLLVTNRVGTSWAHECKGGCAVISGNGDTFARANCDGLEEILHHQLEIRLEEPSDG